MTPGTRCPACHSDDTEMLIQMNNRREYECFTCSNIWTNYAPTHELIHADPLTHFVETGEDNGV